VIKDGFDVLAYYIELILSPQLLRIYSELGSKPLH
jgi:hypothetical protein